MSEVFNTYAEQAQELIAAINQKVTALSQHSASIGTKEKQLPFIRTEHHELEKLIKLMETEIVTFSGLSKNSSSQKIKVCKVSYESIKRRMSTIEDEIRLKKLQSESPSSTSHTLEMNDISNKKSSKYTKLSSTSNEEVNERLKESKKLMMENLDMGDNIQVELEGQTKRLQDNIDTLGLVRNELKKGEVVIKRMVLRIRRNKLLLYAICCFVAIMTVFVLMKVF